MQRNDLPYIKSKNILTDIEFDFYRTLDYLFSDLYLIFSKPRVEDFIHVKKGMTWVERNHYRSHIKSRHTDFLLCDKKTTKPLIAIELDDSSHKTEKGKKRDALMNNIYASAGLKYIHIPVSKKDDAVYLQEKIVVDKKTIS